MVERGGWCKTDPCFLSFLLYPSSQTDIADLLKTEMAGLRRVLLKPDSTKNSARRGGKDVNLLGGHGGVGQGGNGGPRVCAQSECKAELVVGARFCHECGTGVGKSAEEKLTMLRPLPRTHKV